MFTARYGLIPYTKQITLFFKSLIRFSMTATFALYVINWLVFITVVESVYSEVRTDSLYKADYVSL